DRVAVLVQGVEQAPFADDVGRPPRLLLREEAGGRRGAGVDVLFLDVDSQALQPRRDVATGALAVVGQEPERHPRLEELADEMVRPGDELPTPVDHAVHVNKIANHANGFSTSSFRRKRPGGERRVRSTTQAGSAPEHPSTRRELGRMPLRIAYRPV